MSFQQGLSGLERHQQEPRGDRQQHRQRQHLWRQVVAGRIRRHVCRRAERRRQQPGRHRRRCGRGVAAVHAGQHHDHRQSDGPGDQRRRLLPGHRRQRVRSPTRATGSSRSTRTATSSTTAGQKLLGYPAEQRGVIQPGRRRAAAAAHRRHHPAGDQQDRDLEMNLDSRLAGRRRRPRAADRLHRPDDLQQRHLDDGLRRQGPGGSR